MRMMRGIVILGLMLSLPALAVYGDVDELLGLLRSGGGQAVAADTYGIDDSASEVLLTTREEETPEANTAFDSEFESRSVYPTFKPKVSPPMSDDPSAPGKRLRPAIYRPLADGDAPPICRVTARLQDHSPADEQATPGELDEIGRQLQALGAQGYRMEDISGDAHFTCEFPATDTLGQPMVFQARSADRVEAMREVLRQVRAWGGGGGVIR